MGLLVQQLYLPTAAVVEEVILKCHRQLLLSDVDQVVKTIRSGRGVARPHLPSSLTVKVQQLVWSLKSRKNLALAQLCE